MEAARHAVNPAAEARPLPTLVAEDLARVNALVLSFGQGDVALINDLLAHILAAGGKRLRPCLTLACAQLCGYVGARHIGLAAAVEFIHTATLLHDDVVDSSALRRGAPTANALWGNEASVLVGDFLFSRAFQLMVADGSLEVLRILSDASAIIAAGEVQQLMISHDLAITQTAYLAIIRSKTAALFAAACELGAVVADTPHWREPLRRYGEALGMAFQITDDTLDYAAQTQMLGKSAGDDLREGKVTLPLLLLAERLSADERAALAAMIADAARVDDAALEQIRGQMLRSEVYRDCQARAQEYVRQAQEALATLPEGPLRQALWDTAHYAAHRPS